MRWPWQKRGPSNFGIQLRVIRIHARFQAAVGLRAWDMACQIADEDVHGDIWPGLKEYARRQRAAEVTP